MTVWSQEQIRIAVDRAEARSRGETAKDSVETTVALDTEIKKLAALSIGVYESSRVAEAKRLGMRASVLDKLVQTERGKAGKGQKDFVPHWKVGPWPDSVDGAALLETLRQHFGRYVVLPEHADAVLALWTLDTWVFDCRHHAVSGNHLTDPAVRQDPADDDAVLAVLSRQEKRQYEQGIDLSQR